MYRLRFDVETISKATFGVKRLSCCSLRFDVETISKATLLRQNNYRTALRFDVETISKATLLVVLVKVSRCGLM